jgi:hypothetical protein
MATYFAMGHVQEGIPPRVLRPAYLRTFLVAFPALKRRASTLQNVTSFRQVSMPQHSRDEDQGVSEKWEPPVLRSITMLIGCRRSSASCQSNWLPFVDVSFLQTFQEFELTVVITDHPRQGTPMELLAVQVLLAALI